MPKNFIPKPIAFHPTGRQVIKRTNFGISTMDESAFSNIPRRLPNGIRLTTVYLVTIILTMGGSANLFAQVDTNTNDKAETELIAEIPASKHENILYILLTAELAASRHEEGVALHHYLQAAEMTQDPAIAEQATQMAITYQAPLEASKGAELWAKTAPNNLQAQLIAMTLSIGQSADKAIPYLIRALEINPTQVDQYIIEIQTRLSNTSAQKLKEALNQIAQERPKDPYAHLAAAQSAAQQGDIKNANRWVDSALTLEPNLTHALELKARLIRYATDTDNPALLFLAEKVSKFPDNKELRLFYSNALMDNGNSAEAKIQLSHLTNDKKLGGQALVFLGEIFLKEHKFQDALATLQKALEFPESRDAAQYLMGETEERQGHFQAAVRWYSDIDPGSYQIPAVLRATALLKTQKLYKDAIDLLHSSTPSTIEEQKQLIIAEIDLLNASQSLEDAMKMANELLPKLPTDQDVLFIHAVTAAKLKNLDIAETDLRNILKQNPNNAKALNALGYILSFNKNRLEEALQYLKQALALSPTNPAFMDNVGWIYYQLGNINEAKTYLTKANSLSDDPDIATHYGEILWSSDHKEEAIAIWKKAYTKNSSSTILQETLQRFKVKLNN